MPRVAETALLTALALVSFASNSLLARLALGSGRIDAASFTLVRLGAGAIVLAVLARRQTGTWGFVRGADRIGPIALFAYAGPFSFAYLRIGAALGALVLFGAVQATMIAWGLSRGERPGARTWLGLAIALGGLAALTLPSAARPDPLGMVLMVAAGMAWAVYSIRGKGTVSPLATNARNFLFSLPLAMLLCAFSFLGDPRADGRGLGD